jgi:predicted phage baseplate assembly protein
MICSDERRRIAVRAKGINGLDSVDVGTDRRELTVVFFGKAPEELDTSNFHVEGGRRITGIEVTAVHPCVNDDPELSDRVRLTVDRAGDLSTYRLCVVDLDGFDPRYSSIDFRFVTGCDDIDCVPTCACDEDEYPPIEIDYLAKDYASFRQQVLDRLGLIMPQWTERHIPDIGITLVELLAYEGDRLSYHQDAVATEAYLNTARLRTSVRRHARLVDYVVHDGCAARAWMCLDVSDDVTLKADVVHFASGAEVFEPVSDEDISLYKAYNEIHLWTWGDEQCCLPAGATSATLVDGESERKRVLHLAPGDVLIFEELIGPKTGAAADNDPSHRQAVRLTSVTAAVDEVFDQSVVEVTWAREDALVFPLCVRARGGCECTDLTVGVARGNVVLVEHGGRADPETLDVPIADPGEPGCPEPVWFGCEEADAPGLIPRYPPIPIRFRPEIHRAPVTQSAPFPPRDVVARAQSDWLRGLPERARSEIRRLLRKAVSHSLSQRDIDYLTTLFGQQTLRRLHFDEDPRRALRALIARFDQLLAAKLARLDQLLARASGGYVLTADNEGREIGQTWGAQEGHDVDPGQPRFHGPAAIATETDPRKALPALIVVDRFDDVWHPRHDLLDSGPDDQHFVGETDDGGRLHLRFGDGHNGMDFPPLETAPLPDDPAAVARYRLGNGTAGNVGAEAINRTVLDGVDGAPIARVRNPMPAAGGVDPEPVSEARMRAPHDARLRQLRAITADDYAALASRAPGVQRAAADLAWTGSWYEAQVAVDALGESIAPAWLLDDVRRSIHRYRRIGHDLSVAAATLVPLDLTLCVQVRPDYVAGHVRLALLETLGAGRGGYFHPDRLTFGMPVRISSIVAAAAAVPGVASVDVTKLERLFGPPGPAIETGVLAMRPLEIAQLDNDPTRPENGRLQLDLVGGR